ncbi:hypothetical protein WMF37_17500 [Sorangium sp. So ce291]|uniref:hypothetical protein n=1 Tax=Sorangium sp. So ce291 TaxID=3133294 RepID=UPI003F5DBCE7
MSLFVGGAMAHASTPAASNLKALSGVHADARVATPERVAYFGMPAANVATTTQVGLGGIAINTSGNIAQSAVAQAGGFGNVGLATANAQGGHGRGFGYGYGGWRRTAMNEGPASGQADILFDK